MIRRFYIHNFRCLENFELPIADLSSVLLIGKNGSGKSSVGFALEILQRIARGENRVNDLVKPKDLSRGRSEVPMRFEIEVRIHDQSYGYTIAFDFPKTFKELRVFEERLAVNGNPIFTRELAQVNLAKSGRTTAAKFALDWHLAALPIVQEDNIKDPIFIFKQWLGRILFLRPIPSMITGYSEEETLLANREVKNFGAWFSGLLGYAPAAYGKIDNYLKHVMPDLKDIKNPLVGKDSRSLEIQFSNDQETLVIPFADLSDGEKCFMICAMVLAANDAYGPLVCFWDEPDNYLAISEVRHFVIALRKAFRKGGQFIMTSHDEQAIKSFTDENTLLLYRNSHLEHTKVQPVDKLSLNGELVDSLIRDSVRP